MMSRDVLLSARRNGFDYSILLIYTYLCPYIYLLIAIFAAINKKRLIATGLVIGGVLILGSTVFLPQPPHITQVFLQQAPVLFSENELMETRKALLPYLQSGGERRGSEISDEIRNIGIYLPTLVEEEGRITVFPIYSAPPPRYITVSWFLYPVAAGVLVAASDEIDEKDIGWISKIQPSSVPGVFFFYSPGRM